MIKILKRKFRGKESGEGIVDMGSDEVAIVILTDRYIPDMYNAFRDRGVIVSEIYMDIEEMKIGLLMKSGTTRVVIIDTGLGIFNTVAMRDEMVDLVGMCDGKEKRLSVFYTDSILKSDAIKKAPNNTDWKPYKAMSICIDTLLGYKERYLDTGIKEDDLLCSLEDALALRGEEVEVKGITDIPLGEDIGSIIRGVTDIEDDNCLIKYEVSY